MDTYFLKRLVDKETSDEIINLIELGVPYKVIEDKYFLTQLNTLISRWNTIHPDRRINKPKPNHDEYFLAGMMSKEQSDKLVEEIQSGSSLLDLSYRYNAKSLHTRLCEWNRKHPDRSIHSIPLRKRPNDNYDGYSIDDVLDFVDKTNWTSIEKYCDHFKTKKNTMRQLLMINRPELYKNMIKQYKPRLKLGDF